MSSPEKLLPDLPGATLDVHWADFKRLIERRAAVLPPDVKDAPPVPFVLGPAEVDGEVVMQGSSAHASLKCGFDVSVLAEEWVRVPLAESNVGLVSARLDGEPMALDAEDTSPLAALLKGPSKHRVTLELTTPLLTEADQSAFELSLPGPPVVNLSVRIPKTKLDATVTPAVSVQVSEEQGATKVRCAVPSGQTARVAWTAQREKKVEAPLEPPQLFASTELYLGVGDGMSKVVAISTVTVLKAAVRALVFEVPSDATVADVRGPMVAGWETQPGDPQTVLVELRGDCKGATPIELELDRPWDDKPPVKAPLIRVRSGSPFGGAAVQVERESGFVAVAAMTNLELSPAEAKGLTRVDVKELPRSLAGRVPYPIVLAFRFREAGGSLTLSVQRHADLPVVTGMVDFVTHTVLQTADGKRVARSSFRVRNSQRQFLRVALPQGATVWSTLLDGKAVKPASAGNGVVLVPLKKAARFEDTENPFEVEVVTMSDAGALGDKGKLKVPLPTCDLPMLVLRCTLWAPDGYLYDDFSGPLEQVGWFKDPYSPDVPPPPTTPPMPAAAAPMMQMASMAAAGPPPPRAALAMPTKRAAKMAKDSEEMKAEREAAPMEMDELRSISARDDFGDGGEVASQVRFELPKDAGVLPVRMDVPEKGLRFHFEKLLVLEEPLFVETEYAKEKRST